MGCWRAAHSRPGEHGRRRHMSGDFSCRSVSHSEGKCTLTPHFMIISTGRVGHHIKSKCTLASGDGFTRPSLLNRSPLGQMALALPQVMRDFAASVHGTASLEYKWRPPPTHGQKYLDKPRRNSHTGDAATAIGGAARRACHALRPARGGAKGCVWIHASTLVNRGQSGRQIMDRRTFLDQLAVLTGLLPVTTTAGLVVADNEEGHHVLSDLGFLPGGIPSDTAGVRRLSADKNFLLYHAELAPAYTVQPEEIVLVECRHGLPGLVTRDGQFREPGPGNPINPATGPIFVEGIQPGDGLAIDFLEIRPGDWGYCDRHVFELKDGCVQIDERIRLVLQPMIGGVGIAPPEGPWIPGLRPTPGGTWTVVRFGPAAPWHSRHKSGARWWGWAMLTPCKEMGKSADRESRPMPRYSFASGGSPSLFRRGRSSSGRNGWPLWPRRPDLTDAAWQATNDMIKLLVRGSGMDETVARWMVNFLGQLRRSTRSSILPKGRAWKCPPGPFKPGMDTRAVVARFEAERQALAMMDHENMARVLDGRATAGGRPYFVMELVRGVPVTEYCDKNQLTMAERLRLFITVCQAVQHAHQKGIIHRDLKPLPVFLAVCNENLHSVLVVFAQNQGIRVGLCHAVRDSLETHTPSTVFSPTVPIDFHEPTSGLHHIPWPLAADTARVRQRATPSPRARPLLTAAPLHPYESNDAA